MRQILKGATDQSVEVRALDTKQCYVCGHEKPLSDFHADRKGRHGKASRCKQCAIAAACAWQKHNRERVNAKNIKWKHDHRDEVLRSGSIYRARYPERRLESTRLYRETHRERVRLSARNWQRNNPDKVNAIWHARRARLLSAFDEVIDRAFVWMRDGGKCHICGGTCDPKSWHMDHIIPLRHGGRHNAMNVAVSHPECNRKKGARYA